MNKYNINNFYVGELTFLLKFGNVLSNEIIPETEQKRQDIFNIKLNGAIGLDDYLFSIYTNWEKRLDYRSVFTIFYKNNNKYYCLHNGKSYELGDQGEDYCSNLTRLINCLPKFCCNISNEISFKEAIKIFNILFKKPIKKIYTKETINVNDIYLGSLDLCWGLDVNKERESRFYFVNIPEHKTLSSQKEIYGGYGYTNRTILNDDKIIEYDYSGYSCLYLLYENGKCYNLNDFQIYNLNENNKYNNKVEIKKTLLESLDENNINVKEKELTIPKILKLQQNLKRGKYER